MPDARKPIHVATPDVVATIRPCQEETAQDSNCHGATLMSRSRASLVSCCRVGAMLSEEPCKIHITMARHPMEQSRPSLVLRWRVRAMHYEEPCKIRMSMVRWRWHGVVGSTHSYLVLPASALCSIRRCARSNRFSATPSAAV